MKIDINLIDLLQDESLFAQKCLENTDYVEAISYWQGYLQALAFAQISASRSIIDETYDEWCTDCKEYDQERHSCPRWNRVIRETLKDVQVKTDE